MVLGPQPRSWSTTERRASPPPGCAFDTGSFSHPNSPTASHISQIEDAEIRGLDRGPDRRIFRIPRPGHALRTRQLFAALEFTDPAVTVTHLGWAGSRAVTRRYTRRSSQKHRFRDELRQVHGRGATGSSGVDDIGVTRPASAINRTALFYSTSLCCGAQRAHLHILFSAISSGGSIQTTCRVWIPKGKRNRSHPLNSHDTNTTPQQPRKRQHDTRSAHSSSRSTKSSLCVRPLQVLDSADQPLGSAR